MNQFVKYEAMRADGMEAAQAYAAIRSAGSDQIAAIRMLRESYGLTLVEAKKMSFEVDTGQSSDILQPGLEQAFTDIIDDLLED